MSDLDEKYMIGKFGFIISGHQVVMVMLDFFMAETFSKYSGNFGESIFAFFQFTRWLMMLNLSMAVFYGLLIFLCLAVSI